jgi:hypothetical protein
MERLFLGMLYLNSNQTMEKNKPNIYSFEQFDFKGGPASAENLSIYSAEGTTYESIYKFALRFLTDISDEGTEINLKESDIKLMGDDYLAKLFFKHLSMLKNPPQILEDSDRINTTYLIADNWNEQTYILETKLGKYIGVTWYTMA